MSIHLETSSAGARPASFCVALPRRRGNASLPTKTFSVCRSCTSSALDRVPSTGEILSLRASVLRNGGRLRTSPSSISAMEPPRLPRRIRPAWVNHIALRLATPRTVGNDEKARLTHNGVEVLGVTDHHFTSARSIFSTRTACVSRPTVPVAPAEELAGLWEKCGARPVLDAWTAEKEQGSIGDTPRMSALNSTHDPARRSWIESANAGNAGFPHLQNLPFGAFVRGGELRTGVAIGDRIVDLRALHDTALLEGDAALACHASVRDGTLNALMALDAHSVSALRGALSALLAQNAPARSLARIVDRRRAAADERCATDTAVHDRRLHRLS